jgi:hypothetical protein
MLDFFRLYFRYITGSVGPFVALPEEICDDAQLVRHHRRILNWGAATGITTSTAWASVSVIALLRHVLQKGDWGNVESLIVAPLLPISLFLPGLLVGVCFALAVSPAWFLDGPGGQRWRKLIGTRNRKVGRLVCFIGGLGTSPLILLPVLFLVMTTLRAWHKAG